MYRDQWPFQFEQLHIEKPLGESPHRVTVVIGENHINFLFQSATGEGASAPFSKAVISETTIGFSNKSCEDTDRQNSFEMVLRVLSALHPSRSCPYAFKAANGVLFRMDKTAAEWAAESGRFDRVADRNGHHWLRPL